MQKDTDTKAKQIVQWREVMETLPSGPFFALMRTYLGEIQTPFNKHKLIERLSSVLRNVENRRTIGCLLSDFDIKILTALTLIPGATRNTLELFFSGEYSPREVSAAVMNLADRLLIYYFQQPRLKTGLYLNPLLDDTLSPFIDIRMALPPPIIAKPAISALPPLSPLFFAAFISYVRSSPDLCKIRMGLKKKDALQLEKLFPAQQERLEQLLVSCINLEIFRHGEKGLFIDEAKLSAFADLNEGEQLAFLSIAAAGRFRRDQLSLFAQLLLNAAATIPSEGLTRQSLTRLWLILTERQTDFKEQAAASRFNQMLAARITDTDDTAEFNVQEHADAVLNAACAFGLFEERGRTEDGTSVFTHKASECEPKKTKANAEALQKAVSASSGNSVTIFPMLPLPELLQLTLFMDCTAFGTAAEFEINKKSACRAFDQNLTPEQLCKRIERFSAYPVPDAIKVNFDEWYSAYTSAILYKGYVLKADARVSRLIEKTPALASHIQCRLADGVYFLNIPLYADAANILTCAGLSMTAGMQTAAPEAMTATFPKLSSGKNQLEPFMAPASAHEDPEQCAQVQRGFLDILEGLELEEAERACLTERIKQKIIINQAQISADTMKLENLEAEGTEYFKKLRLLEDAAGTSDIAEIFVPLGKSGKNTIFYGSVKTVTRDEADAVLTLQLVPFNEERVFSVSKIIRVKIIRTFRM